MRRIASLGHVTQITVNGLENCAYEHSRPITLLTYENLSHLPILRIFTGPKNQPRDDSRKIPDKQVVEYINCYGNKVTLVLINLYNAGGEKNDDR